jgi:formylmethanofuran dehydrogenase subunit E
MGAAVTRLQKLPDDRLLRWQSVKLSTPLPIIPEKHAVTCSQCGDRVNEHQEIVFQGATLCKACAFGAYYQEEDAHSPLFSHQSGKRHLVIHRS